MIKDKYTAKNKYCRKIVVKKIHLYFHNTFVPFFKNVVYLQYKKKTFIVKIINVIICILCKIPILVKLFTINNDS